MTGWIKRKGDSTIRLKVDMWFNVLSFAPSLSKEIDRYVFIEEAKERKGKNKNI